MNINRRGSSHAGRFQSLQRESPPSFHSGRGSPTVFAWTRARWIREFRFPTNYLIIEGRLIHGRGKRREWINRLFSSEKQGKKRLLRNYTNGPIRGCVNGFSWFYFYLIETIELLNFWLSSKMIILIWIVDLCNNDWRTFKSNCYI